MESDERMPVENVALVRASVVCVCVCVWSGSSKRVIETSNQSLQQATEGMQGAVTRSYAARSATPPPHSFQHDQ